MPQENRKRRSAFFAPIAFLLVILVLVFVLSVFFQVSAVEVEGNSFYSQQELEEASGIQQGDNLFFINRFSAASRIFARLPYVEGISIEKKLPGSVIIHVTESEAIACVYDENGDRWAIDRGCKLLSQVGADETGGLITIEGMTAASPAQGDILTCSGGDVGYLSDILSQIYALGLRQRIECIHMSSEPSFDFDGRFTVKLGENSELAYKFQLLIAVVAGLQPGDCGTLDLSIDSAAHLSYD